MRKFKLTYFITFTLVLFLFSCRSTRLVPQNKFLLHKNEISFVGDKLNADEVGLIVRQQPNHTFVGVKFKLFLYNSIDSAKVHLSHLKKLKKVTEKNAKKRAKQNRINAKRIEKARLKGKSEYTHKIIPLIDSVNIRSSFREWIKYKKGEKPVVFDSTSFLKSIDQLQKYIKSKGYYYGSVSGKVVENIAKRTATVKYEIAPGKAYYIDSFVIDCPNPTVKSVYQRYLRKQTFNPILGEKFDEAYLDAHRYKVAKYMRDNSLYGFSPTSISYVADSSKMKLTLRIVFSDRQVKEGDSVVMVPYRDTYVQNVYFHVLDTNYYKGNFKSFLEKYELPLLDDKKYFRTIDTLHYRGILMTKKEKKERKIDLSIDTLNPWRFTTVYYNGKPAVRPDLLELQNYLENSNAYKEYYVERSFNRLVQLDVFQTIKPELIEIKGTNKVEAHYYLTPAKKQAFNVEQRFSNSNGFLGLSASLNYNNKNLFRGSEKLTISFGGGFESQPPVFDESVDGQKIKQAGRSFNTFEIGPSIKFDLPGLALLRKATKLSKRHRPRTVVSSAYNYQKRNDFSREIFQLNFLWKFYMGKTQVVQVGMPAAAIKYVRIDQSPAFKEKLNLSNDLFLKNAYSNQFVWENLKVLFEFNNKMSDKKKKANFVYNASLINTGYLLSLFDLKDTSSTGQKQIFGVAYSRFLKIDNDAIFGYPINKKLSFHARGTLGLGIPRGNNTTSLPFDYSFFAGGSNDNRGWRAKALGPGSYKYYLDLERTATQIGDVRMGGFTEIRYSLSSMLKTAFFVDAGNIWTYQKDDKRVGGQFSKNFYKEIALSTGVGVRLDFTFLVVRLDLGIPLTNPALPNGAKWIFQSRQPYYDEGIAKWGINDYKSYLPKPFIPMVQFGIGYPF